MNKKNLRKGFTTVELVIVIAVIAILATALIPTFGGLINSANNTAAMNKAREVFNNAIAFDLNIFAEETDAATKEYYIYADGYYFEVEGGKLNTKGSKTAPTSPTLVLEATTTGSYIVCKTDCADTDTDGKCDVCGGAVTTNTVGGGS